ncbi:hypothetical protein H2O64_05230 [Kordia sp. YSTF-M3]|uniref:Uncharacterized protein n=1 Tax=Kordia aestuariivivens TaxID=2759037 RepID=A0ABR7Q672_9FLAO|nr:hypothetical protein [Kordia aestuariivivens]MBC8754062.1 hypothetical protein [Kordia aestuariivivens]
MKHTIKVIILFFCLLVSGSLFAQNTQSAQTNKKPKTTKKSIKSIIGYKRPSARSTTTSSSLYQRNYMPFNKKKVWVLGTNKSVGHWDIPQSTEIKPTYKNKQKYVHTVTFNSYKSYKSVARSKAHIPQKEFNVKNYIPHTNWISKTTDGGNVTMEGVLGKTNVYYHKNINLFVIGLVGKDKYDNLEVKKQTDHIIVTDTLFIPLSARGFMNMKRNSKAKKTTTNRGQGRPSKVDLRGRFQIGNRSYIKIIAGTILYEKPIQLSSVWSSPTDFVFSSQKIKYQSPYKGLNTNELTPSPPLWVYDNSVKLYIDPFKENEGLLLNRLYIEILGQIATELQNPSESYWEKDKRLAQFQTYRSKINTDILRGDVEYHSLYKEYCDTFDRKYNKDKINEDRSIGSLKILVDGNINDLPQKAFKYYAIPTKATLLPVKNEATGTLDKLGDVYYNATGDSKFSLTIESKLGYNSEKFTAAGQVLHTKGLVLEKNPPKALLEINAQPLKANGKTIGRIIPIGNQILRFEFDLVEENLSLLKLFLANDNTFNLDYKTGQGQKEDNQEITLEIPESILKQLDYTDLINEFNVVESNTSTLIDAIKITSNLSPVLKDTGEGTLKYIEISLEFLFEDKTVFRGPKRFSSHSVKGSEDEVNFMKYSDNYTIKVTGTAYYEFGHRDIIKDNSFTNTKFITLQESMFKSNKTKE